MNDEYVIKMKTHDIYFTKEHFFMLTDRERKVLELRFSLNGNKKLGLGEIANLIVSLKNKEKTVSRERIRQILAKTLSKLRHSSRHTKVVIHD